MMHANIIEVQKLDPARFMDLDLSGEEMRQGALRGICAGWARKAPFYVMNAGVPHAVAGRYQDVRDVFQDQDRFSATPQRAEGFERLDFFNGIVTVAQTDGAEHDRIRRALQPYFSPAFLATVDGAIRGIVDGMLDEVAAKGGPFDCMQDFAGGLVVRILLDGLLGLTPRQQSALVNMNRAFSLTVNLPPGAPRPPEYLAAEREASQVIGEMISERRTRPRDKDFVSALLAGQSQSGALSDAEIAANIFGICIAGQGTTSITSATMLMNLCKHREQFNQVISDPKLIPQTVEEALRYQGPGFFGFPRFAVRDCEVGGTPVLKGMPVLGSQQAAGWDPDVFPEPERFDIHRKPKNILTFGSGRHHCLGNRLARQVLCIVLEKVCLRFPNLRLQDPAFEPHYEGMFGEVKPSSIPMHTGL